MSAKISREDYLQEDFDYTRLTKQELRSIMSENNVDEIPPITALKSTILEAYKTHIHDRISILRKDSESNFSNENIFQSFSSGETPADDTEIAAHHADNVEVALPLHKSSDILSGPSNQSDSSSGCDSPDTTSRTANQFNKSILKPDTSFINASSISLLKEQPTNRNVEIKKKRNITFWFIFSRFILVLFVSFIIYLKFYSPYCSGKTHYCVPLPPNAKLVGGCIQCEDGYHLVRGIVDHCILDRSKETIRERKVEEILKLLESIKGNAEYGYGKVGVVRLSDLSDDPEVVKAVCNSSRAHCQDEFVEAVNGRISARLFLRYYLVKIFKAGIPIILLILFIKLMLWRHRKRQALKHKAKEHARRASELLSRQLACAARSNLFLPHIREDKLRDALGLEFDIWNATRAVLLKNSNVSVVKGEGDQNLWQWTGPLLSDVETV